MSTPVLNTRLKHASGHSKHGKPNSNQSQEVKVHQRANSLVSNWLKKTSSAFEISSCNKQMLRSHVQSKEANNCDSVSLSNVTSKDNMWNSSNISLGESAVSTEDKLQKRRKHQTYHEYKKELKWINSQEAKMSRKQVKHDNYSQSQHSVSDSSVDENEEDSSHPQQKDNGNEQQNANPTQEAAELLDKYKERLEKNDTTVFYNMFELMIMKMASIESSVNSIQEEQVRINERISIAENSIEYIGNTIDEVDEDVAGLMDSNLKITDAIIKIDSETSSMKDKILQLDTTQLKGCFTLSGLIVEKNSACKEAIGNFLAQQMGIKKTIKITSAHKISNSNMIWFKIEDPDNTTIILKSAAKLKNKQNSEGKNYYINEFLPEKTREEKRRNRDIIAYNRSMPVSHQMECKFQKGKLMIDGNEYKKEVTPPTVRDVLLMPKDEEDKLNKIKMNGTVLKEERGSTFRAYSIKASTLQQVRVAYNKLKNENLDATHIMCAYRIFGAKVSRLQDYSDDGEHGGGRAILNIIKEAKIWNFAVFVVRHKFGSNLGKRRFELISEVAKMAISSYPGSLEYGKSFTNQKLFKALNQQPPKTPVNSVPGSSQQVEDNDDDDVD